MIHLTYIPSEGRRPSGMRSVVFWTIIIVAGVLSLIAGIVIGYRSTPSFEIISQGTSPQTVTVTATETVPSSTTAATTSAGHAGEPNPDYAAWIGPADDVAVQSDAVVARRQSTELGRGLPADQVHCAAGYEARTLSEFTLAGQSRLTGGADLGRVFPNGARWAALPGVGAPLAGNPMPTAKSMQRYFFDFGSTSNMPNKINRDRAPSVLVAVFQLDGAGDMRAWPIEMPTDLPSAEFRFVEFSGRVIVRGAYSCLTN